MFEDENAFGGLRGKNNEFKISNFEAETPTTKLG